MEPITATELEARREEFDRRTGELFRAWQTAMIAPMVARIMEILKRAQESRSSI